MIIFNRVFVPKSFWFWVLTVAALLSVVSGYFEFGFDIFLAWPLTATLWMYLTFRTEWEGSEWAKIEDKKIRQMYQSLKVALAANERQKDIIEKITEGWTWEERMNLWK